ncbi:serine hydrolase [Massilia sp. S19_KUP03_FR1]|uniref:serine hydrolase n=1 Tax=Massilia sp. S19_KUP03_FR1 TaxID=3025503 RepID=UPI002FCDC005
MPHMLKICLVLAVAIHAFSASAQTASAPVTVPALSSAQIDAAIGQYYKPNEPGAVVLVAKDGKTIFRKAYGLADAAKGTPMTPDMQLRLGSITKQFTSTAILLLVDEGKIKLDDDITRFLPDYPARGKRITVENLLNHTSGIASYTSQPDFEARMTEDVSVAAMIDRFKNLPLDFDPGSAYRYSNSGYFLLGAIIEKVSGQSYADFLEQRIFKPLGMNDTAYEGKQHGKATFAAGHTKADKGFEPSAPLSMTQPYAAGALVSTVDDLARWDVAVASGKLLKPATWQRAFAKTTLTDGKVSGYAYGWGNGTVRGVPTIGHDGGINGFSTSAIRVPSAHVYVVVLHNTDSGIAKPDTVAKKLVALAVGKPYAEHAPVTLDAKALDAYVGTYKIDDKTQRIVRREGATLSMQRTGRPPVLLSAFSPTGFSIPGQLDWFEYSRNSEGAVVSMTLLSDGEPQVSPRVGGLPPERAVVKLAPATFDKLVGRYQMHPTMVLELTREGDRYFATPTREPKLEIFPASETVFFAKVVAAELHAENDAATGAPVLVLHQDGVQLRGTRLP